MICRGLTRDQSNTLYREVLLSKDSAAIRKLCLEDLFFLLTIGCKRKDIDRAWLYESCREVEINPNGFLDLWAREHYKSTIITYGLSIKDILNDPNVTIGIFSHTRPIAKAFLKQIKTEFETNTFLKSLFPDILYTDPKKEAPRWSLDEGIRVKRTANPKEETIEAWGLVDGQPTSKHFKLMVYDDVVTRESVTTPEQIKKVTEALELSYNLGAQGGSRRFIGTRYHANDTYKTIMDRGTVIPRIKPATNDGTMEGEPVLLEKSELLEKRRDQGPYTFSCQMLQNPIADKAMGFKVEWLKYYKDLKTTAGWNKYLLADPASKKKKTSDYTVMAVVGLAPDGNYYLIDGIHDRLNLTERATKLFYFHRKHHPRGVGYEEYGLQADIEHMQYMMEQENYRFNITPIGGSMNKEDRIRRLIPIFEQGRFWLPERLHFVDHEAKAQDFTKQLVSEEYEAFPVSTHDDMLDCLSRILDPDLHTAFPKIKKAAPVASEEEYLGVSPGQRWMS